MECASYRRLAKAAWAGLEPEPPVNAGAKLPGWPEKKFISDAGQKAPRTGGLFVRRQAWVGLSAALIGAGRA